MSSTLVIAAKTSWMPTSWVFGEVVGRVRTALPESQDELAKAIDHVSESGFPFLDLSELDASATVAFERAARQAFDDLAVASPSEFGEPSNYVNVQWALSELLAMLRHLREGEGDTREIVLPGGAWRAPAVVAGTVAEHIAVWLLANSADDDVASSLLAPSTSPSVDLTVTPPAHTGDLRTAIERVTGWNIGAGKVWVYAPLEQIVIEARLPELAELAQASWS